MIFGLFLGWALGSHDDFRSYASPEGLLLVARSDSRYFPVVDENGRMTGIFSLTDIRRVMNETETGDLVLAKEIGTAELKENGR